MHKYGGCETLQKTILPIIEANHLGKRPMNTVDDGESKSTMGHHSGLELTSVSFWGANHSAETGCLTQIGSWRNPLCFGMGKADVDQ